MVGSRLLTTFFLRTQHHTLTTQRPRFFFGRVTQCRLGYNYTGEFCQTFLLHLEEPAYASYDDMIRVTMKHFILRDCRRYNTGTFSETDYIRHKWAYKPYPCSPRSPTSLHTPWSPAHGPLYGDETYDAVRLQRKQNSISSDG